MSKKILVMNWKMNPAKEADAIKLAKASDAEGVIVCPPFPFLKAVKEHVKKAMLGAQDLTLRKAGLSQAKFLAGNLPHWE